MPSDQPTTKFHRPSRQRAGRFELRIGGSGLFEEISDPSRDEMRVFDGFLPVEVRDGVEGPTVSKTLTTDSTGQGATPSLGASLVQIQPLPPPRVFMNDELLTINYLTEAAGLVTKVEWMVVDDGQPFVFATGVEPTPSVAMREVGHFQFTQESAILPLAFTKQNPRFEKVLMHLRVFWVDSTDNKRQGIYRSATFTVVSNKTDRDQMIDAFRDLDAGNNRMDTFGGPEDPNAPGPGNSGNPATPTGNETSPFPTMTNGNPGTSDSSPTPIELSGQSSRDGRLPNGAIAGIAVACGVLALVAVGLLIWWLIRRRRRHADHVIPYDGSGGQPEYMADKETQARVAESPHSPYSDDGHVRDSALLAATHDHGDGPDSHDRSFPPYTDTAHGTVASAPAASDAPAQASRSGARSSTPQGLSRSVAHLVEEGMTEQEIRRLEEEERALDAAIAQAGRR